MVKSVKNSQLPGTGGRQDDDAEAALLGRIAAGDRDALTALYARYHSPLFNFTFRLAGSHAAADELVNDIMLVVWRNARGFRGASRVSTWIFGIAYRQTMRRVSRRKPSLLPLPGREASVADDADTLETEDWVRRAIDTLPPEQKLTVMLVFYLGLSYPEVAEVADCPVNTVKTRMYHARRKLERQLKTLAGHSPENAYE